MSTINREYRTSKKINREKINERRLSVAGYEGECANHAFAVQTGSGVDNVAIFIQFSS